MNEAVQCKRSEKITEEAASGSAG